MKKHTMNPVDEKIIIKKLKAGDNEAYKYLYDYHYVALCKLSYYMLKDKIQAESIVSDVIFHLWEIRENLGFEPTTLTAYISATSLSKFQIGNETVTIFRCWACPTLTAVCLPNFRVQRYGFLLKLANI